MSLNKFIYVKDKSLSIPLVNKIIELYNTLCNSTDMNESNIPQLIGVLSHTNREEKQNEQYLFLLKLQQKLDKELRNHFYNYLLELSSQNNIECHKLKNISFEKNDYIITKRKQRTDNIDIDIEQQYPEIGTTVYMRLCKYMWFLTDYDGEIHIGNIILSPKKGTLIIYPISWICPVIELINKQTDIYILYGYVNMANPTSCENKFIGGST